MSDIRVRFENKDVKVPASIQNVGPRGASAYEQAKAGGYEGTEAQFNDDLAAFKDRAEDALTGAEQAQASAQSAARSKEAAEQSAEESASKAAEAAQSAVQTAQTLVEVQEAGRVQIEAVNAAGQTQQESVRVEGIVQVQLAKDWAVKTDGVVESGEYSAKKYAQDAANSAAEAQACGILPAGMIISGVMTSAPTGFLLCNGQAVSRTRYADLFAVIGSQFGAGDGSGTFNVPDYRGCFLRGLGGASGTLYQKQPMGAPDIYGDIRYGIGVSAWASGAISIETSTSDASMSGGPYKFKGITFRAGASNSVYGAADEVRPVNFAVNYYIKY